MDKKQTLSKFEKALKETKRKYEAAALAEQELFKILDDMGIDAQEIETSAENADNLHEAITCYLSYNEYSVNGIMEELKDAYTQIKC